MPKPSGGSARMARSFALLFGSLALFCLARLIDLARFPHQQERVFGYVFSPPLAWTFWLLNFTWLAFNTVKRTRLWLQQRAAAKCEEAHVS